MYLEDVHKHVAKEMFEPTRREYINKEQFREWRQKYVNLLMQRNKIDTATDEERTMMAEDEMVDISRWYEQHDKANTATMHVTKQAQNTNIQQSFPPIATDEQEPFDPQATSVRYITLNTGDDGLIPLGLKWVKVKRQPGVANSLPHRLVITDVEHTDSNGNQTCAGHWNENHHA